LSSESMVGPVGDEEALWARLAQGDQEAREELILAYRPMVFWLARRLGNRAYQDVVQEGMLGLLEAVDNFDPSRGHRFSTYAYYRIRGRMINFLSRVEGSSPIPVEDQVLEELGPWEDGFSRLDWTMDLQLALGALSEREADVVRSLVLEDVSARELAEEKGLDVSYIHKIRRRALAKLREVLSLGGA